MLSNVGGILIVTLKLVKHRIVRSLNFTGPNVYHFRVLVLVHVIIVQILVFFSQYIMLKCGCSHKIFR